jgi:hypothetical protein
MNSSWVRKEMPELARETCKEFGNILDKGPGSSPHEVLPQLVADRLRTMHREGFFMDGLKIGHIIISDWPGKETGDNPGIHAKRGFVSYGKEGKIKTVEMLLMKVLQDP